MKQVGRILIWGACLTLVFAIGEVILNSKANYFNSDLLYAEDLANDIFKLHGHWSDWSLPPAPDYVPSLLLYFVGYAFLPSTGAHIYFTTAGEAVLLTCVALWLARRISHSISDSTRAVIIMIIAATSLVSAYSGMMLYFNSTNWHIASLLFSLLSLGLFLIFVERRSVPIGCLIIISIGVAQASDAIYVISFMAPAAIMLIGGFAATFFWPALRRFRRSLGLGLAALGAGELLALMLESTLTFNDSLNSSRIPLSKDAARNSWHVFYNATLEAFKPDNKFTMSYSILVAAAFIYLVFRTVVFVQKNRQMIVGAGTMPSTWRSDWRILVAGVFTLLVIPCNLGGDILSGGLVDPGGYRYLTVPIAMIFLLTTILLGRERGRARWVMPALSVTAILVPLAVIITFFIAPTSMLFTRGGKSISQVFAVPQFLSIRETETPVCLTDLEAKGVKLQAGVSDYWLSRSLTEQLPQHNPMLALDTQMKPYFWMTTMGPLYRHDLYPRHYNFVVLPQPERYAPVGFTTDTIGQKFPKDHKTYPCPKARTEIWVYDNDDLDSLVRLAADAFLFKHDLSSHTIFMAAQLPGNVGDSVGSGRVARAPKDTKGILSFGPYIDLKQGQYRISVNYVAKPGKDQPVGRWDVTGNAKGRKDAVTLYADELRPAENGHATAIINIPKDGIKLVEFHTFFSGHGSLEIKSFEIDKMN